MGEPPRRPDQVPAAHNVMSALRFFSSRPGPVTASALSQQLGLPRSSTYHLLAAMIEQGFVVHLREEGRYALGLAAFEIGSAYSRQTPLQRIARPMLARLVDSVGQSGHLAVLHGTEVLYLIEERAPGRPGLVTDVDVRLPASLTASGRAMLARLGGPAVEALFPRGSALVLRHGVGPDTPAALRRELAATRRRGFALEQDEITPGFCSVAVAVTDRSGHPMASLAMTYRTGTLEASAVNLLANRLKATSAALALQLGARASSAVTDQ